MPPSPNISPGSRRRIPFRASRRPCPPSASRTTPYTIRVNDFIERPEESDARDYGKILIDPDYAVTDLDLLARKMQSQMILVLVTSDKIIALDGKGPGIRVHSIADTPDGPIITHEQWGKLAEYIRVWLVPATALCVTVALFHRKPDQHIPGGYFSPRWRECSPKPCRDLARPCGLPPPSPFR
ncbi:MAG: hypothetical protein WDO70_04495 [Alphaproteobacteria bacterium]